MKKVVLGLSGGMDSATLLGFLLGQGAECHCVFFHYGSKHNKYEHQAAVDIVMFYKTLDYPVTLHYIDLSLTFSHISSNLLQSGGDIPEGHYEEESMKLTVVPGRNMIFASIMAGIAESIGADTIALGTHKGDHCIPYDETVTTINGKVPISSIVKGDYVLSQNLTSGEISFKKVLKKIDNGFRKDILEIIGKGGRNIRLTSNHKVFQIKRSNFNQHNGWQKEIVETPSSELQVGDWILTPAIDRQLIESNSKAYTIDLLSYCDLNHSDLRYSNTHIWFKQNNKVNRYIDSVNFIKLIAWYITEGSRGSSLKFKNANTYRTCISQSKEINTENYVEILNCIKAWGFTPCETKDNIWFSGPTTKVFELCGTLSYSKIIPNEFLLIHPELLFNTLIKGDGSRQIDKYNREQITYVTTSISLKEQVCWLATVLGYSAGINLHSNKTCYHINIRKDFTKKMNKVGDSRMFQIQKILPSKAKTVYDLTIEDNHTFFAGSGSGILVSNSIYPDCRADFIEAVNVAVMLSTEGKVLIRTPLQDLDKTGILKLGLGLATQVPYRLSRTCYCDQQLSCGKCGSCDERMEAFANLNMNDPIPYE